MSGNNYHINDDLLVKYLLDEATPQERVAVEEWIAADQANEKYFEHFQLIWTESKNLMASSEADEDAAWQRFKTRISPPEIRNWEFGIRNPKPETRNPKLSTPLSWLRIAALFILVAGVSFLAYLFFQRDRSGFKMLTAHSDSSVLKETLPDGSVITLNKNSSISYPEKFTGNKRQVTLRGEAFFNVTPDNEKPFMIQVNDISIKVVGTSFNVRSENGQTEVIVETGIVEVIKNNRSVELRPKEKTVVRSQDPVPVKETEKEQLYNYYRTKEFVCDNTPLWKLVEVLNDAYQVNIVIGRPELRAEPIDVTFSNESLDQILKVISLTLSIKVDTSANRIILR